jgi:hypothetical protein
MPALGSRAGIRITNNNGRLGARCFLTNRYQQAIRPRHTAGTPADARSPESAFHLVVVI